MALVRAIHNRNVIVTHRLMSAILHRLETKAILELEILWRERILTQPWAERLTQASVDNSHGLASAPCPARCNFRARTLYLQGFRKMNGPNKVQFGAILVPSPRWAMEDGSWELEHGIWAPCCGLPNPQHGA